MAWEDLLFAHWPVEADLLRPHVPRALAVDRHGGTAWITVACFRMDDAGLRGGLRTPGTTRFPELNVRTYVTMDNKPGVWFWSLDAPSPLAVAAGRAVRLPYRLARMDLRSGNGTLRFASTRRDGASFRASYHPTAPPGTAATGSLDAWLTERYCLYAERRGRVWRQEIHHPPWPLQPVDAAVTVRGLTPFAPDALRGRPARMHYARRLDVVAWSPERVV